MSRHIEFGIETGELGTDLSISGPSTPLRLSTKRRELAKPAFDHKVFRFDKVKTGTRARQNIGELTLLSTKLAGVTGSERKKVLKSVLDYLWFVGSGQAEHMEADPGVIIHDAFITSEKDTPEITLKAPSMGNPRALEETAIKAMTGMAKALRYSSVPTRVLSVSADRQKGLEIYADTYTGDALTVGKDYNPKSGFMHLYSEGSGNSAQKLTALTGVIAIAKADSVA